MIILPQNLTHFGLKQVCVSEVKHTKEQDSVHFISTSVPSAVQTVTDGLALSSEETSRTNCEALTAASAQLCTSVLCVSLHEHFHRGSVCSCFCVFLFVLVCFFTVSSGLVSCLHLHLYPFFLKSIFLFSLSYIPLTLCLCRWQ